MRLTTLLSFGTGLAAGFFLATPNARALFAQSSDDNLDDLDANGDGMITANEREAASEARFERLDTNADGRLGRAEFERGRANGDSGEN